MRKKIALFLAALAILGLGFGVYALRLGNRPQGRLDTELNGISLHSLQAAVNT